MKHISLINTYVYFNIIYYVTSLICFIIDINKTNYHNKLQIKNRDEIIQLYKKVFLTVFMNVSLFSIPYIYINCLLLNWNNRELNWNYYGIYIVIEIIIIFFFTDFLFYSLHRLFHTKKLYKFHKKHHEINKPIGISALYMNPIDMYFANMIPVTLPFILLSSPIQICYFWTIVSIIETISVSHNGYKNWSDNHDYHHKLFNVNYGTTPIWDILGGSYFSGKN